MQKFTLALVTIACVQSLPVAAEQPRLSAGTPVPVVLVEPISSKTAKIGDRFLVRTVEDVRVGNTVVITAGTSGTGEITRVVRKGAFGRSGKIETRMLYIGGENQKIALSGRSEEKGKSGLLPTIAVTSVAGPFSGFVTGRSAELPAGQRLTAYVNELQPSISANPG